MHDAAYPFDTANRAYQRFLSSPATTSKSSAGTTPPPAGPPSSP